MRRLVGVDVIAATVDGSLLGSGGLTGLEA
jgi:hypothetical protein